MELSRESSSGDNWLGSFFTYHATPRTPAFARASAEAAGLRVAGLAYAAPAMRPLGHTLVLGLQRVDTER